MSEGLGRYLAVGGGRRWPPRQPYETFEHIDCILSLRNCQLCNQNSSNVFPQIYGKCPVGLYKVRTELVWLRVVRIDGCFLPKLFPEAQLPFTGSLWAEAYFWATEMLQVFGDGQPRQALSAQAFLRRRAEAADATVLATGVLSCAPRQQC